MKYRVPVNNEIIDIPVSCIKTEREKTIIKYDIRSFEDDQDDIPHWEYVAGLIEQELGWEESADSVRSVKDRVTRRVRKAAIRDEVNSNLAKNIVFRERDQSIEDRKEIFQKWIGSNYESEKRPLFEGLTRRVVVVSDYHGTIHPGIMEWLLKNNYEICIHAGDILDQWSFHVSRINGTSLTAQEKETYLDEEIQTMRAWFETLDKETLAQHIVLTGNHDARVEAAFVRLMGPLLRRESLMLRMFRTPLELLVEGLENFELGSREMQWTYPLGGTQLAAVSKFIYQLDDVIISHMNFTGKQPGAAVGKLWDWIQSYRLPLDLSDIRLCCQAHTHKLTLDKNCQAGHVNLVETGCAMEATALGYGLTYNGNWTPSAVGLVSFKQHLTNGSWQTDLNSVKLHGVG
jgi:predicted phosphodiesterase